MAKLATLFAVLALFLLSAVFAEETIVDITIPNPVWDGNKTVLCTAYRVEANQYITMFFPLHRMKTVRHISVALMDVPYSDKKYWECPTPNLTCGPGRCIALWAMAKDGPAWYLPKGVAIPTGKKSGYVVVQVHGPVGMKLPTTTEFFATGIRLKITDQKPAYYSATAAYGNVGYIPANAKDFTADAACAWPYDNNPIFGISLHSHTMATAITAYIFRNGSYIELMRADPVYPEPIIDISNRNLVLKKGDTVLMRCTLTNPQNKIVKFGFNHDDQMCDFYLFYGIPPAYYSSYKPIVCAKNAQHFNWIDTNTPKDSTLPDKKGYAKLIAPFHLKKRKY